MAAPLSSVPMPAARRWLLLRQRVLPPLVFVGGILLAATIWQRAVSPPTFVAEVETIQADVRSTEAGALTSLEVELLQPVTAGTVVGHVLPADPELLAASLAVIRAEVEFLRAGLEPAVPGQRMRLEAERLQLDWMRERVNLASLRAQLTEAEANLSRLQGLRAQNLIAEETFTTAQNLRDGLITQTSEQQKLVTTLLPALASDGSGEDASTATSETERTLAAAIRVQEQKLRLTEAKLGPIPLRAPIDGIVSAILRHGGETIVAGEAILRVSMPRAERLVGFARQPLAFTPRAGQTVEVRTRTPHRVSAASTIEQVGSIVEPIPPALLTAIGRPGVTDSGLRVLIRVPAELALHPGEWVDVIVHDRDSLP